MIRRVGLWMVPVALMLGINASALQPAPPPTNHSILSKNGLYRAAVSVRTDRTTIKRVRRGWFDKALWSIPEYFEYATVSDDGNYLFDWNDGGSAPLCTRRTEVLSVWLSDGTTRRFTVGHFVTDVRRMPQHQVMGRWMVSWGHPVSTHGEWIKVETCQQRTLYANVKTGEVRAEMPVQHRVQGTSVTSGR